MLTRELIDNVTSYIANRGIFTVELIGFIGPLLVACMSIYGLWGSYKYLFTYVCFFLVNMVVNKSIKLWIRQPRPTGGKSILGEVYGGADEYGMPSAHAQSVLYSVVYLYLSKGDIVWLLTGLGIALLTIYQRWAYRRHTFAQLLVGALCGCIVAYIANFTAIRWITEKSFW
jgi:membrane-associated phospholipid phosphatase